MRGFPQFKGGHGPSGLMLNTPMLAEESECEK